MTFPFKGFRLVHKRYPEKLQLQGFENLAIFLPKMEKGWGGPCRYNIYFKSNLCVLHLQLEEKTNSATVDGASPACLLPHHLGTVAPRSEQNEGEEGGAGEGVEGENSALLVPMSLQIKTTSRFKP